MNLLQQLMKSHCSEVHAFQDAESGLKGFIAFDRLGQSTCFGGIRFRKYASEQDALTDAIQLSKAMANKCVISQVPAGGAKIVVMETAKFDRPAAFRRLGQIIHGFGGGLQVGRDLGTTMEDMENIRASTPHVVQESESEAGDLAKCSAYGVFKGMEALASFVSNARSLRGKSILIQGLGGVGMHLLGYCNKAGAKLILSDIRQNKARDLARRFRCQSVKPDAVYDTECDIFAPCAVGQVLNKETIKRLKCKIVAGSANNVYAEPLENDKLLYKRGIVTVPDYLLNSGALIQGANYILSEKKQNTEAIEKIYDQTLKILRLSRLKQQSPLVVASQLIDELREQTNKTA